MKNKPLEFISLSARSLFSNFYYFSKLFLVIKREKGEKYKLKKNYTPTDKNPTFIKLNRLMSNSDVYKNPQLSLSLLSDKLEITPQYLSQIINKLLNKTFSEYVNYYRVEEIKKMLLNDNFDKYSILSIGYEAGFNSKSVFYTAFKKQTGLTPKQFKDENSI